ncbi:MAG: YtxH domain-containing protein, partial [Agathobaculum butyriciproducens]
SAIKGVNEFSSDISNGVIDASAKILAPDAANTSTGVATIRDCLFGIQVKQPWLLMQFGDTDVDAIGEERVNDLLGTSPKSNKGEDREEVVKAEIEDYDNGNLTITEVNNRLGLSCVFLIFNIIISVFAVVMAGSMLLSQVLFLISAMFLPISLLISMMPAFAGTSKRAVISLFNTIMLRVGTTLLTTFVLMLSSIVYSSCSGMAFILVLIMQLVVFAGVYMQKERLLGMIGLQPDGAGGRMGRAIAGRSRGVLSRTMRKALPFGVGYGIGKRSGRNQTTQHSGSSGTGTASRETSDREDTQSQQSQQTKQTKPNFGRRVGETVGKIADTPSRVKDKAAETAQKVKD